MLVLSHRCVVGGDRGRGGVAGLERILADTVCDPTADPAFPSPPQMS